MVRVTQIAKVHIKNLEKLVSKALRQKDLGKHRGIGLRD